MSPSLSSLELLPFFRISRMYNAPGQIFIRALLDEKLYLDYVALEATVHCSTPSGVTKGSQCSECLLLSGWKTTHTVSKVQHPICYWQYCLLGETASGSCVLQKKQFQRDDCFYGPRTPPMDGQHQWPSVPRSQKSHQNRWALQIFWFTCL